MKYTNKRTKKTITIFAFLLIAAVAAALTVGAFFSDVVTGREDIRAGTLNLAEDSVFYYINGSFTPATPYELDNINPGDYVTAEITVSNVGSKSAWLLMDFTLSGADGAALDNAFEVYEGTGTLGRRLTGYPGYDELTFSSAGDTVIDGTFETEPYSVGRTISLVYTLYFKPSAGNEWQNVHLGINYSIKALQYRNNPAPNWSEAVVYIP